MKVSSILFGFPPGFFIVQSWKLQVFQKSHVPTNVCNITGKLPSEEQTQRMKRLNSGRLLEKFGQSVKTPIKSQALIAQSTMYNVHPIAGEAIPQAITSALFLYRHTELQVRQLVDEDNSYNYSQSCFL